MIFQFTEFASKTPWFDQNQEKNLEAHGDGQNDAAHDPEKEKRDLIEMAAVYDQINSC